MTLQYLNIQPELAILGIRNHTLNPLYTKLALETLVILELFKQN